VPHKGWRCVEIEEHVARDHLCEMCEARIVRFVHVMAHENYPATLRVGCVCAGNMEGDLAAARTREAEFRGERARKGRWLSRPWRLSARGNQFLNTNDGFNVVVFKRGPIWAARVEHRTSGYSRASSRHYGSSDAAKLAAFEAMLDMKRREPWKRRTE
jgi:hypothetical protein